MILSSHKPLKWSTFPPKPLAFLKSSTLHRFYFKTTLCSLYVEVNLRLNEEPSLSHIWNELVQVGVIGVYLQCMSCNLINCIVPPSIAVLYLPRRSVVRLLPWQTCFSRMFVKNVRWAGISCYIILPAIQWKHTEDKSKNENRKECLHVSG